jgi:thymidylate synthase
MKSYLDLLRHVMEHGKDRTDRTGVGTRAVFGYQFRHDLRTGFPLLTTKKVHFKSIAHELLWFLRGETNIRSLQAAGVSIWDEWAAPNGDLGPVYGKQWRSFGGEPGGTGVDQIANLVCGLRASPDSRRHIVTAWTPEETPWMKLPPCHTLWQCQVDGIRLHLHLYARSIDSFLGLPFNIASYALLLHLLAQVSGLQPGELIISFGDLHIYQNHFAQVQEQLSRPPRPLPQLSITPGVMDIDAFRFDHFLITGYDPHPAIKAPVAV